MKIFGKKTIRKYFLIVSNAIQFMILSSTNILHIGFPSGSMVKNLPAHEPGDMDSIPGLGRSPEEGNDNPFQYSCLGSPMDRGTWRATVPGVAKEWDTTYRLNNSSILHWWLQALLPVNWAFRLTSRSEHLLPFNKRLASLTVSLTVYLMLSSSW